MNLAIFCIGTWHDHTEPENVLVALNRDCQYASMGRIDVGGNHVSGQAQNAPRLPPRNGGYKLLVDGQGGAGTTLGRQAEACIEKIIEHGKDSFANVCLVGHSRGAALAILIASRLAKKAPSVKCQLFLYDPVKRASKGRFMGFGRGSASTIGANVTDVKIVAAEDEGSYAGKGFKLLNIHGAPGAQGWVRIPGTHGTMTQVTGHPIGAIGYMLAAEWMTRHITPAVPLRSRLPLTLAGFLAQYSRINRVNRTATAPDPLWGSTQYRLVNDTGSTKTVRVGGRNRQNRLNRVKANPFMGRSKYFINLDHYHRFANAFPNLAKVVAANNGGLGSGAGADSTTQVYRSEFGRFAALDPAGFRQAVNSGAVESPPTPRRPPRGVRR